MLGATLWLVVVLGVLATVALDTVAGFGRAAVHAAAEHALGAALDDGLADFQARLRAAMAADPSPASGYANALGTLPNPLTASTEVDAPNGARLTVAYTVTATTLAPPACPPDPPSAGADAVVWLQCSSAVGESRLSLRVDARVLDPGGAVLAQRAQYATLRLFGEPPYGALVGREDASAAAEPPDALTAPAHEGDLGGAAVGTLIHVRYECHDGAGSCANAAPPDPDAALVPGVPWSNGNRSVP
ncbi:MAG: hypothetical protein JOZ86_01560 [Candidatus Eremiobacteraeota bacterium]|nr:hypothetical protein [Candidatus Eremiobacteraeota bacterium]